MSAAYRDGGIAWPASLDIRCTPEEHDALVARLVAQAPTPEAARAHRIMGAIFKPALTRR